MVTETSQPNGNAMEMGNANQDLASKPQSINRKKIVVTAIVGCLVVGLIILGIVLLSGQTNLKNGSSLAQTQRKRRGLSLEEILDGSFTPARFNGTFISDTEILYKNENDEIVIYDVIKKETKVVLSGNNPVLESSLSYQLSADRKYLLVAHTFQKLYRYSYIANYDIFNLETKRVFPLKWNDRSRMILLAQWAPTGSAIAFVLHDTHDIYYKPTAESPAYRITNTGIPGVIYNGVPDWVNEEEVFSSNVAMWFSRDNKKLAFASFNDTLTRVMSIPFYGIPGNLDFQYTRAVNIRYPKPGSPNPTVRLHIADLEQLSQGKIKVIELPPPDDLRYMEPILTTVTWASEDKVSAVWMNRVQNLSYITLCEPAVPTCTNILSQKEPKGWIDMFVPPLFSSDGSKMVLILPKTQGSAGDYRHVCLAEKGNDSEFIVRALSKGKFTVTEVLHFDDARQLVYFLATAESHPERLHLYEVSTEFGNTKGPKCISCSITHELQGENCLYNKATFSGGNNSIYAFSCLGPSVPTVSLYNLSHKKIQTWEDNSAIFSRIAVRQLPVVKRLEVPIPGSKSLAQVVMYLPPDLDTSGKVQYPLLVNVYGGPDSYQSTEKFNIDWSTYLTVNRSIIYVTIDGRGSGLKGNDMLFAIYRRLGTYEIEDQINVTSYLQQKFPYIDKERMAIWGWSYGGYATGMALAQDRKNVFKCGISVAPVTDWAYYDTIYTERYMGLPRLEDNLIGYANAQLNDKVENLRGKQYFLIHGTLDDNVHYQQSMMLSKALELSDILFRQQSYPDEEHGLSGVRPHLYHSLEKFLDECFDLE